MARQTSLLGVPGTNKARVIQKDDSNGYNKTVFSGKEQQMAEVMAALHTQGFVPESLIEMETNWFYSQLGIDDLYFANDSVENIASYVLSLYAAKVQAYARSDHKLDIRLERESDDRAVFIHTSTPGVSSLEGPRYEDLIDKKYISPSVPEKAFRLETFRSASALEDNGDPQHLRCYFVNQCDFFNTTPNQNETDLKTLSDKTFWEKSTEHTKRMYQDIMSQVVRRMGPVIELMEVEDSQEYRLVIGHHQNSTPGYFSALSHLYHYYGVTSTRKYVEQFSNGITIVSLYLVPAPSSVIIRGHKKPPFANAIFQILREASLLYCLPNSVFSDELARGDLSLQEAVYAHCGFIFVSHFLNRLGAEYETLMSIIDVGDSANRELMERLKRRLRGETFTREFILELLRSRLDVLHELYLHFANTHYVQSSGADEFLPTLSYQRLQTTEVYTTEELAHRITKNTTDEHELIVLQALLRFNSHVLKTNFYTPTKVALSFRLDPSFLPTSEYPQPLYGMFLVVGQEFRGFHLRFRDVARGGIRIVRSRNKEAYSINARSLFDENYNLANTQQRKNKDIPEGGSKGVILLDMAHQDKMTLAFEKYIDSIIDLLIPGQTPGIKEAIVDLYGKEEILFMGPDENTAGLVDWATQHARARGAPWWKSFFTGKSPTVGGIPHDEYGMTSLSVREYVKGIYRKLDLNDKQVFKLQTGGPDGDLGSNEILLSTPNETYVAIVDGSGVLADPNGLDKTELVRLAKARTMISGYDVSKLSPQGYRVLIDDNDVTLPSGQVVVSGVAFRNTYHIEASSMHKIDIFVPCGGRPEAINLANVHKLINEKSGRTNIPYIVEGANLFITQSAKLELEAAGCVIFKDASANKGGVTSSSLEVLASLAFDDKGFFDNMCVPKSGNLPEFYKRYVREVQSRIQSNADLEFEAIWRDHELTGKPRSVLSDTLSIAINELSDELSESSLWQDVEFRNAILRQALPNELISTIGIDTILTRVPDAYLRAIFGSYLAGRYIYEKGTAANQFAFFEFMVAMRQKIVQ